jgi:hypothetical protein
MSKFEWFTIAVWISWLFISWKNKVKRLRMNGRKGKLFSSKLFWMILTFTIKYPDSWKKLSVQRKSQFLEKRCVHVNPIESSTTSYHLMNKKKKHQKQRSQESFKFINATYYIWNHRNSCLNLQEQNSKLSIAWINAENKFKSIVPDD